MMNEIFIMISIYHMLLFSQFLWYSEITKFYLGFSASFFILLMLFLNIILMINKSIKKFCQKRRDTKLAKRIKLVPIIVEDTETVKKKRGTHKERPKLIRLTWEQARLKT